MNDPDLILSSLSAPEAAARLLGSDLIRTVDGHILSGRIVETEVYDQGDPSSHSYRGLTKRNSVMFGSANRAYVYFTYGMHYCLNIVVGQEGYGAAVLIRALEPLSGQELMLINRGVNDPHQILNGPAKLTQALKIDLTLNGHDLSQLALMLKLNPPLEPRQIKWGPRIGLSETSAKSRPLRAVIAGSKYLSRPL